MIGRYKAWLGLFVPAMTRHQSTIARRSNALSCKMGRKRPPVTLPAIDFFRKFPAEVR